MDNWKVWIESIDTKPKLAFGMLILLTIPLTVLLVFRSQDTRSSAATPDQLETEAGVISSSGVTKQSDSGASGGSYVLFNKQAVSNTPTPTPPPSTSGQIYGPGIAIDSKYNIRIGSPDYKKVSHRFRAKTTSRAESIAWELRTGDGYSLGDGGRLKISIQSDDGSSNHYPSGQILTSVEFVPGNGSDGKRRNFFPNPPQLTKGQLYHVVWENIASDPVNNYVSLNNVWTYVSYNPRQPNPNFRDDYSVIVNGNGNWGYKNDLYKDFTAQMDLTYEDGAHEGQAYSQAHWNQPGSSSDPELIGIIEGQRQTRELFTVTGGNKVVTAAYVRVARDYGSGDLTIALKNNSGTILGQGSVPASQISDYASNPDWYLAPRGIELIAGDWVSVTFNSPITLTNGSTYQLVMTSPNGTKYAMVPIRYGTWDDVVLESWAFREGRAQQSNNGGNSWENNYAYQPYANYQFYFTLQ